ncbi:DNA polymerase III subunit delta' [Sphingomonas sp.]
MTSLLGNAAPRAAFDAALASGAMHHAWLIAGPEGVGKARFATDAARHLLDAHTSQETTAMMMEAGSHPRFRRLMRLPKDADKPEAGLARSIPVDQIRALGSLFGRTVDPGERRVVLIDAIDDLERAAANALLKSLEEPPPGTIFLLVSHAPGKLLPTIRSRCRTLRFSALDDQDVKTILRRALNDASDEEVAALAQLGAGSPGRALRFAGLDLARLERDLAALVRHGDPDNTIRAQLAKSLGGKAAQERYRAFVERVPSFLAEHARGRSGEGLRAALDARRDALRTGEAALGLSLDPAATAWELGGIVARLARTG